MIFCGFFSVFLLKKYLRSSYELGNNKWNEIVYDVLKRKASF